jgi:hypothetical protein
LSAAAAEEIDMSLGHSPANPDETPRQWTLVEKIATVVAAAVIIIGALLIPLN